MSSPPADGSCVQCPSPNPFKLLELSLVCNFVCSPLDILVIGGGATGCGIAVDAATRGLRTALVEREDFAGKGFGAFIFISLFLDGEQHLLKIISLWRLVSLWTQEPHLVSTV